MQGQERPSCGICEVAGGKACAVCRPLPAAARADLAAMLEATRYRAGSEIDKAAAGGISVLAAGLALAERRLADQRRQVVTFRFPGDVLCLDSATDRLRLVAVTPVTVCRLSRAAVEEIGRRHAELSEGLLQTACRELVQLGDRMLVLGRLSAPERIATFLLEMLARGSGETDPGGGTIVRLAMSREDIADYLGLNLETVSRTLSRFKRQGLIRLPKPGRAVIGDTGPLAVMAPLSTDRIQGDG